VFLDKLKGYHIVLASASPRRQELLGELGLEFEVYINDAVEEKYPEGLGPKEIPVFLAELKARDYPGPLTGETLLITADTIVWLNGKVAHKPTGRKDAIGILEELSGARHEVITGVCFRQEDRLHSFHSATTVWFSSLGPDEITYYVDNYAPFDKAGAYGIQEWIGFIGIEKIEGSYFNVMGLPVQKVYNELKEFIK